MLKRGDGHRRGYSLRKVTTAITTPARPTTLTLTAKPNVTDRKWKSRVAGFVNPIVGPRVRTPWTHPSWNIAPSSSPSSEPTISPTITTKTISPTARWAGTLGNDEGVFVGDDAVLSPDRLADELREVEGMQVRGAAPVLDRPRDPPGAEPVDRLGGLLPRVDALGREDEAPGHAETRDERLVAGDDGEHLLERPVDGGEEGQFADLRHAGLHRHHALRAQALADQHVELPGEQHARRPFLEGLHEVDDDQIEALVRPLEVRPGVLVPQFGARIVEGAPVHLGQVLAAERHHLVIDVDHDGPGDGGAFEDFAKRRPFAAADHERPVRLALEGQKARMDQRLVVDELVGLARLDPPVEHETLAVRGRIQDLDLLELGLGGHDRADDGVHVPLDRRRGFEEPLVVPRVDHPLTPGPRRRSWGSGTRAAGEASRAASRPPRCARQRTCRRGCWRRPRASASRRRRRCRRLRSGTRATCGWRDGTPR